MGASFRRAKLKKVSPEGSREEATHVAYQQAGGCLRLSNNVETGAEVCQSLLSKSAEFTKALMDSDLPAPAQIKVMELTRVNRLMSNAIYDIKSSNNDLLKGSLCQYQSALQTRREAWLSASTLPQGLVNEFKSSDYPKPAQTDKEEPLGLFGPLGSKALEEYSQTQRDAFFAPRFSGQQPWVQQGHQQQRRRNSGQPTSNFRGRGNGRGGQQRRHPCGRGHGRGNPQPFLQAKPLPGGK